MTATEPRGQLDHAGSVLADPNLRIGRPVPDPERLGRGPSGSDESLCCFNTKSRRPGVGERDPERRRLGGQPVSDGQGMEDAVERDCVHGHLRPLDVLLGDEGAVARGGAGRLDRGREIRLVAHQRQSPLALPVGRLDDTGNARLGEHARLRQPGGGEAVALARLRGREHGGRPVDRVRQPEPLGEARGDPHGPVRAGRDDAVDPVSARQPVDSGLVLRRDDGAGVGVAEARRCGIAIDCEHVQVALARCAQEPELRRSGA